VFYVLDLLDFKIDSKIKLIIIAIIIVILLAIIWLFGGKIPLVVHGKGVLLLQDQYIFSVVANTKGILEELKVFPGSNVKRGQIVGKTYNPTLQEKLLQQKRIVQTLSMQKNEIDSLLGSANKIYKENLLKNQISLKNNIQLLESTVDRLAKQYKSHVTLFKKKVIAKNTLYEIKHLLSKAQIELNNAKNELTQLDSNKYFQLEDLKYKHRQLSLQLAEANKEFELFSSDVINMSSIITPVDGKILEHKIPLGMWVNEGTTITSLLVTNNHECNKVKDKYLFAYFPARLGKLIRVDMTVKVTPTIIFREEYGSIIGVVDMVSPFPVSKESMFSILHNESLVQEFYNYPSLIFVRIKLKHNPKDFNGFFWTSKQGPKFKIEEGTIADAMIILEYKKPIHLIMS